MPAGSETSEGVSPSEREGAGKDRRTSQNPTLRRSTDRGGAAEVRPIVGYRRAERQIFRFPASVTFLTAMADVRSTWRRRYRFRKPSRVSGPGEFRSRPGVRIVESQLRLAAVRSAGSGSSSIGCHRSALHVR